MQRPPRPASLAFLAVLALAVALALGAAPPAAAEPRPDPGLDRCDTDTAERLGWLDDRLALHARYAYRWWQTWNAVFVAGIAVEGTRAGFEDASGERANHLVSVAKSGIGLARNLWSPPHVKDAPRALDAVPIASPADCVRRLALAEDVVLRSAEQARDERLSWRPHLGNLLLNLAGALIVAEAFDEGSGWGSGAVGFVIGEIRIFTYPWQAGGTLDEYSRRFPAAPTSGGPGWRLEPFHTGARVTLVF